MAKPATIELPESNFAHIGCEFALADNGFLFRTYKVELDEYSVRVAKTPDELAAIFADWAHQTELSLKRWAQKRETDRGIPYGPVPHSTVE